MENENMPKWPESMFQGKPWKASIALLSDGEWIDWAFCGSEQDLCEMEQEWQDREGRIVRRAEYEAIFPTIENPSFLDLMFSQD